MNEEEVKYYIVYRKAFFSWRSKADVYKTEETAKKYCGKHRDIVEVVVRKYEQ